MFVIGLTGGIGSGKTQASRFLEEQGAAVINADILGHEAYEPNTKAWQEVVNSFGEEVLAPTGEVDRKKLGKIVFNDAEALGRLNAIMRPRIHEMVAERIGKLGEEGRGVVVVEAALLLEANWTPLVDEVWVTAAPEEQVLQRLRIREGMDEKAIRARIRSQMPQAERIQHAHVVLDNSGSLGELRAQVQKLWESHVQKPTTC
jgi:dephospho-CoA kinase